MTTIRPHLASQVGYVATPVETVSRPGPWPGVVLVHDVFGLGDDMREQADWLAAAGYVVAVPDLFAGKTPLRCVKGAFAQLAAQHGPMYDRIEAARALLAADPSCTGTVGVIGFCMGGGFALLMAGRPGWSAASVNYGMLPEDLDAVLDGACPLVASYGGKDRVLAGATDTIRASVQRTGVVADVKEYPDAGHGFMNRLAVASPLTVLMKVAGMGYDHAATADAKRRILMFFDSHLSQADGTTENRTAGG